MFAARLHQPPEPGHGTNDAGRRHLFLLITPSQGKPAEVPGKGLSLSTASREQAATEFFVIREIEW
jgi:hypothetical protein